MNSYTHPILTDLSKSLPKNSITYKYIHGPENFEKVAAQAREEFECLSELDADPARKKQLTEYGYEDTLKDLEDEDRLRLIGVLKLVIELAEELAEEY